MPWLSWSYSTGLHITVCSSSMRLEISQLEKRQSSIGLAKFKVSQGDYARAREIADLFELSYGSVGLREYGQGPMLNVEIQRTS